MQRMNMDESQSQVQSDAESVQNEMMQMNSRVLHPPVNNMHIQSDSQENFTSNRSSTADHQNEYYLQQQQNRQQMHKMLREGARPPSGQQIYSRYIPDNVLQAEFSGQKSSGNTAYSPLPSQYNALYNKRENSSNNRTSQQRWASSNGFKLGHQQQHFQTLQPRIANGANRILNEQAFQSLDPILHSLPTAGANQICHGCTVNSRSLGFNTLFCSNSIIYSQNVPILLNSDMPFITGQTIGSQSLKYLRFEIEVLKSSQAQNNIRSQNNLNNNAAEALYFSLSEDSNPLQLYLATIDIKQFLKIRKQQRIFVEFSDFAEKVQALLDFCIANKESTEDQGNRFVCMMNTKQRQENDTEATDEIPIEPNAIIEIFEYNDFRNLLHLRVDFKKASPEETSSWLSKKLLMQRKLNLDLQQENFDLNDQHEQDRQRINQIKQSLLQLKSTQNEELQRIKEEHESQLENSELSKRRELDDLKNQYQSQIQELTQEFEERLSEIKNDADSLRQELSKTQSNSKKLNEALSERDNKIEEQSQEILDLQNEKERLKNKVQDLKDSNNDLDRKLLEQTIIRETAQKEIERMEKQADEAKEQMIKLENQNDGNSQMIDQLKENLFSASEQIKSLQNECLRNQETIEKLHLKIQKLKVSKASLNEEILKLNQERSIQDGKKEQLESQIIDFRAQNEKLEDKIIEKQQKIETLEAKLKEDQQTLMSNKTLIEYLNKTISEAQKLSFRNIVSQKSSKEIAIVGEQTINIASTQQQTRTNTISPLRSTSAGAPGFAQEGTSTYSAALRYMKPLKPYVPAKPSTNLQRPIPEEFLYKPQQTTLSLPLTEYYLSKQHQQQPFSGNTPQILNSYTATSLKNQTQSHIFTQQLEHDRIISEEKLKQRLDKANTINASPMLNVAQQNETSYSNLKLQNSSQNQIQNNYYESRYQANGSTQQNLFQEGQFGNNNVSTSSKKLLEQAHQLSLQNLGMHEEEE